MIVIDNAFEHGQMVYLKTDNDQKARIVISFEVFKGGELVYKLSCGEASSFHYEFEISTERDATKMIIA